MDFEHTLPSAKSFVLEFTLPHKFIFGRFLCVSYALLLLCPIAMRAQMGYIVGTWAASPMETSAGSAGKTDETLREVVHVSIPGSQLHITLSNEFGHEPLTVGAVTLAHRLTGNTTDTPVPVTFSGKPTVIIPAGQRLMSDMVSFSLEAQSDVAVSLFIPAQRLTSVTAHPGSTATNYSAAGDQTSAVSLTGATPTTPWRYLVEVDVSTATQHSIVCLGDSITDGAHSSKDTNQRWPDLLAARLLAQPHEGVAARYSVLNEGIGGNRILTDGTGPSAVARFSRDVLDSHGSFGSARAYVIVLEGINDIGHAHDLRTVGDGKNHREDEVTADELIAGYHLLIVRAHAHGLRVIGATLTPYVGAMYASPDGEKERQALNAWIRTTKELDGLIDFDKAARDPANPGMFLPAYDSGDHLHPNDAGMKAMADSIDLALFAK